MARLISQETFEKFNKILENYEVANSQNKSFCPYPDCGTVN